MQILTPGAGAATIAQVLCVVECGAIDQRKHVHPCRAAKELFEPDDVSLSHQSQDPRATNGCVCVKCILKFGGDTCPVVHTLRFAPNSGPGSCVQGRKQNNAPELSLQRVRSGTLRSPRELKGAVDHQGSSCWSSVTNKSTRYPCGKWPHDELDHRHLQDSFTAHEQGVIQFCDKKATVTHVQMPSTTHLERKSYETERDHPPCNTQELLQIITMKWQAWDYFALRGKGKLKFKPSVS